MLHYLKRGRFVRKELPVLKMFLEVCSVKELSYISSVLVKHVLLWEGEPGLRVIQVLKLKHLLVSPCWYESLQEINQYNKNKMNYGDASSLVSDVVSSYVDVFVCGDGGFSFFS